MVERTRWILFLPNQSFADVNQQSHLEESDRGNRSGHRRGGPELRLQVGLWAELENMSSRAEPLTFLLLSSIFQWRDAARVGNQVGPEEVPALWQVRWSGIWRSYWKQRRLLRQASAISVPFRCLALGGGFSFLKIFVCMRSGSSDYLKTTCPQRLLQRASAPTPTQLDRSTFVVSGGVL